MNSTNHTLACLFLLCACSSSSGGSSDAALTDAALTDAAGGPCKVTLAGEITGAFACASGTDPASSSFRLVVVASSTQPINVQIVCNTPPAVGTSTMCSSVVQEVYDDGGVGRIYTKLTQGMVSVSFTSVEKFDGGANVRGTASGTLFRAGDGGNDGSVTFTAMF